MSFLQQGVAHWHLRALVSKRCLVVQLHCNTTTTTTTTNNNNNSDTNNAITINTILIRYISYFIAEFPIEILNHIDFLHTVKIYTKLHRATDAAFRKPNRKLASR